MKKNMTILAALALGAGVGTQGAYGYDALRPAENGIEAVQEGETLTYHGKEGILTIPQNVGATTDNRTAIVKDGLGTLILAPASGTDTAYTIDHSLVVREGTMIFEGVHVTNTTRLASPNLTIGGKQAHLILENASYEHSLGPISAIVVGGRDGDGTLTLKNGSTMSNAQAILAGYPSKKVLTSNPTDSHVTGSYKTSNVGDGLYRDKSNFSSDFTYSGGPVDTAYMSKAVINVLEGSTLTAGLFIQTQNAEINIDGEGSLLRDAGRMVYEPADPQNDQDNNFGEAYGFDSGNYKPKTVINITNGGRLWLQDDVLCSYDNGGSTQIHVSGAGSVLDLDRYVYNCASPWSTYVSSSLITITDGASASVWYMVMGNAGSGERSTVVQVDPLSTYEGDYLEMYPDALFENGGTTTIEKNLSVSTNSALVNAQGASLILGTADVLYPHAVEAGGYLINDGQFTTGSVCLVQGTLAGSGEMDKVDAQAGSTVYVGGTPVFDDARSKVVGVLPSSGTPHFSALTLAAGTTLRFYVDGDVAATAQNTGAGTYSNLTVDAGGLTFAADGVTASLTLGPNVLKTALRRVEKALPIELVKEKDAAGSPADKTLEMQMDYQLTGEHAELFTVAQRDTLWLVLAPAVVRGYVEYGAADLLNTLWTGTGTVQDFARKAVGQAAVASRVGHEEGISLWGAGLGYFTTMGSTHGFDYNSGGYAVGADGGVLPGVRVGAAFGQTFGTFKADSGTKVDQDGLMVSLYGSAEQRLSERLTLRTSAYAAYGQMENEGRTRSVDGTPGRADWDDDVWTFGVQTELRCAVTERFTVSPFVGLDYVYGAQEGFAESFSDGLSRSYDGGAMQVWRMPVGVRLEGAVALGGQQYLFPELTLAYVGDISRSNPHATVGLYGTTSRVHGNDPGRNAFMLNAGVTWKMSEQWATGASYQLEVRDSQTAQGVNGFVRYRF